MSLVTMNTDINTHAIGEAMLPYPVLIRDFGFMVYGRLRFSSHADTVAAKAHVCSNIILKCRTSGDCTTDTQYGTSEFVIFLNLQHRQHVTGE